MFYVLLLEENRTRKRQEFLVLEFETSNNKKYKVEAIWDSVVYVKKVDRYLLELYYLVVWKGYLEDKNI